MVTLIALMPFSPLARIQPYGICKVRQHVHLSLQQLTPNRGGTPLFNACYKDHVNCINLLLDKGSNVNDVDEKDLTPLHIASAVGATRACKTLLMHKAGVNAM